MMAMAEPQTSTCTCPNVEGSFGRPKLERPNQSGEQWPLPTRVSSVYAASVSYDENATLYFALLLLLLRRSQITTSSSSHLRSLTFHGRILVHLTDRS